MDRPSKPEDQIQLAVGMVCLFSRARESSYTKEQVIVLCTTVAHLIDGYDESHLLAWLHS